MGSCMHPPPGISGAVPMQKALSLCPSAAFSGVLLAHHGLIREPGKGPHKGRGAYLPPKLPYWTTLFRYT
jgi:hypothetical protein